MTMNNISIGASIFIYGGVSVDVEEGKPGAVVLLRPKLTMDCYLYFKDLAVLEELRVAVENYCEEHKAEIMEACMKVAAEGAEVSG